MVTALERPIFWTPEKNPTAVALKHGPEPLGGFRITTADLRPHIVLNAEDMVRIDLRGERFDLEIDGGDPAGSYAAMVILDEHTPDRLTTIGRFWLAMKTRRVSPDHRLTPQKRERARLMLRAVDARQAGATYRAVAKYLFPQHETEPATWVGSAIRETTIRLARDGLKLVEGGYLTLLRLPRRRR